MTGKQIYDELGGNDFAWLSGCSNFVSGANYLSMRLPKNKKGATYLKIESNDHKTVNFVFFNKTSGKPIQRIDCVYRLAIKTKFAELTGLCTSVAG